MGDYKLTHHELSQYRELKDRILELDEAIFDTEQELAELEKYNMSISPVANGLPKGNAKIDKICDFVITLQNDRARLQNSIEVYTAERTALKYKLHKIVSAVNKITDEQLREIVKLHYFQSESIIKVAFKFHLSQNGVYKKLERAIGGRYRKHRS